MPISRSLVAFAFAAQEYEKTQDLVQGLLPLFRPIAAEKSGEQFSPKDFSDAISKRYGIRMHPNAAESLAPRLAAAGMLEVSGQGTAHVSYRFATMPDEGFGLGESEISSVVDDFVQYATDHFDSHNIKLDNDYLEAQFLDRLVQLDFVKLILKPEPSYLPSKTLSLKEKPEPPEDHDIEAQIDFLVARFLLDLAVEDDKKFSLVVKICSGAMLAEVVLDIQSPPTDAGDLKGLIVYLDGPLILDALDLSDESLSEYAKDLMRELQDAGATLLTFPHVIEEMHGTLTGTLSVLSQRLEGYGPLVRRLQQEPSLLAYAQSVRADVAQAVEAKGIEIRDFTGIDQTASYKYFNGTEEEYLANNIGMYLHAGAKLNDAKSVAQVLRIRYHNDTVGHKNFGKSGAVFVTRNSRLAQKSTEHLRRKEKIGDSETPPCITDVSTAGILWMLRGGKSDELTRKKLIASCSSAVIPRRDVITKMYAFLSDLDLERAQYFEALMTNSRAAGFLMSATIGDATLLTRDNFEEVYKRVEATAGEKVREEMTVRLDELRKKHSEEMGQKSVETERLSREVGDLQDTVENLVESQVTLKQGVVNACVKAGVKKGTRRKILTFAMFAVLTFFLTALTDLLPGYDGFSTVTQKAIRISVAFAGTFFALLGIDIIPNKYFGALITKAKQEGFENEASRLGFPGLAEEFRIDWKEESVTPKLTDDAQKLVAD